jgi:hypothetical protein
MHVGVDTTRRSDQAVAGDDYCARTNDYVDSIGHIGVSGFANRRYSPRSNANTGYSDPTHGIQNNYISDNHIT